MKNLEIFYSEHSDAYKIVLKTHKELYMVELNNILFLQSDGNYTNLILVGGCSILVSKNLNQFQEPLKKHNFLRVHNSFIINIIQTSSISRMKKCLKIDNYNIPISSRKVNTIYFIFKDWGIKDEDSIL
jgi:two-component system, LytTR family, response regulator